MEVISGASKAMEKEPMRMDMKTLMTIPTSARPCETSIPLTLAVFQEDLPKEKGQRIGRVDGPD
jgi:hypothetical protein